MSYSFNVRAASKAAVMVLVAQQLAAVAAQQVCHATDQAQAEATARAFVDVLPDDESKDVYVSMNGSLGGAWEGNTITKVSSASVSVTASLVDPLPSA